LLAAYRARTGMSDADLSQMMDAETFISGEEAVEMNFADALLEDGEVSERRSERTAKLNARRVNEIALRAYAPDMTRSERKETMNTVKPSADEATTPSAGGGKQDAALMDAFASFAEAV
jgi:ATP-dependent Clp protease, protease subunit